MKKLIAYICILLISYPSSAFALAVFPGAEGTGTQWSVVDWSDTTPDIYFINTLTPDTAASQLDCATNPRNLNFNNCGTDWKAYTAGLETAMEASGARIVVFETSGVINVGTDLSVRTADGYLIVAGQTAPSPGITVRGGECVIGASNVLIQHVRFRLGDEVGQDDCVVISPIFVEDPGISNIVLDHCSLSWAIDGTVDIKCRSATQLTDNVTISNSILAEHLHESVHASGVHSNCSILTSIANITYYRNIFAHNFERNPQINATSSYADSGVIFVNNLLYNVYNPMYTGGSQTGAIDINAQGNVVIAGSQSTGDFADKLMRYTSGGAGSSIYMGAGNYRND